MSSVISVMPVLTTVKLPMFAGVMPAIRTIALAPSVIFEFINDGQGDAGFIEGQVLENGLPVSRRVMCYHRRTGMLIKHTRSSDSGYFRFDGLASGIKVFIASIDDSGGSVMHKAVIGDFITVLGVLKGGDL